MEAEVAFLMRVFERVLRISGREVLFERESPCHLFQMIFISLR